LTQAANDSLMPRKNPSAMSFGLAPNVATLRPAMRA
jgi:hypothetical protein